MLSHDVINLYQQYVSRCSGKNDILENSIRFLKKQYGVSAIGIRIREGDDYPYYTTIGFSDTFVRAENFLCNRARDKIRKNCDGNIMYNPRTYPCLDCLCGSVISENINDKLMCFRPFGSFYTGSTSELLESFSEEIKDSLRNKCNMEGYETVFLVPIKYKNYNIGLLQLNDQRDNLFGEDELDTIEAIALSIGSAVGYIVDEDNNHAKKQQMMKENLLKIISDLQQTIKKQLA